MGRRTEDATDAPRALVEELLDAGLTITDLLASLLDEVPDLGPEETGETVIARVVDTCRPALAGVPAEDCLAARALLREIRLQAARALKP